MMDHYQNPRNYKLKDDESYQQIHMSSESCHDDIFLQVLIRDGVIQDIRFDGNACVIAIASTSIMSELVKGSSIRQVNNIIDNYFNMISQKDYDEQLLKEAVVFDTIGKQVNRISCATIGWKGLKQLIAENEDKKL